MVPIYLCISINSESDELSSGRKTLKCAWDNGTKKVIGDKPEINEVNNRISQIQVDLKRHFIVLDAMFTIVTPEMLKNVYHGLPAMTEKELKGKKKKMTLQEAADRHISFVEEMVDRNKLAVGTLKTFRTTRIKLREFLKYEFDKEDIKIVKLNVGFAYNFYEYLTLKDPAAYKYLSKTNQFIAEAKKRGLIDVHPLQDF